jgi:hypothetical protein
MHSSWKINHSMCMYILRSNQCTLEILTDLLHILMPTGNMNLFLCASTTAVISTENGRNAGRFSSLGAKVLRQRDEVSGNASFSFLSSFLTAPLCINHATHKSEEQKPSTKAYEGRQILYMEL